jgi:hypothetical protein
MTKKPKAAEALFISYRRHDSDAAAGRIHDRLKLKLPDWTIFFDVSTIEAGADFRTAIETAASQSATMVVIVGRGWIGERNHAGVTRINEAGDVVRFEVATALNRGLRVIPVLINDAKMPPASELPLDIQPFSVCNAIEVRHSRFDADFSNLLAAVEGKRPDEPTQQTIGRRLAWIWSVLGGAFVSWTVLFLTLAVLFEVTSRPVSHWIGTDGVILLLAATAAAGSVAGHVAWKKWIS